MFPEFLLHDGERTAIELACEMDLAAILILCPVRVIDVWREQFALVAAGRYQFLGLRKKAGVIREKSARASLSVTITASPISGSIPTLPLSRVREFHLAL